MKKTISNPKKPSVRQIKYVELVNKGKTKTEAAVMAGYSPNTNTGRIENAVTTQEVRKELSIKDAILAKISREELSDELTKNVKQDDDRGAKNAAIKIAFDRIEPQGIIASETEQVIIQVKS